jgi:NADH dehydrogenase (ubiquinone) 1 beta subcomplex subunit 8
MPDDGMGFGDYPKLARVSSDMKSDWENWDDTYNKRNFGEPVYLPTQYIKENKIFNQ